MDVIPVGYLKLVEAFSAYCVVKCRPGGPEPTDREEWFAWYRENSRLTDAAAQEFQSALEDGKLSAVIYRSGPDRFYRITASDVRDTNFFGRLFYSETVNLLHDEPLARHEGETILIEEVLFSHWFETKLGEPWRAPSAAEPISPHRSATDSADNFYIAPSELPPVLNYPQCIVWIVRRDAALTCSYSFKDTDALSEVAEMLRVLASFTPKAIDRAKAEIRKLSPLGRTMGLPTYVPIPEEAREAWEKGNLDHSEDAGISLKVEGRRVDGKVSRTVVWSDLRFPRDSVLAAWPPVEDPRTSDKALTHSGLVGRPSSRQLILAETKRRIDKGEANLASPTAEAHYLQNWLKQNYPFNRLPGERSIANMVRGMLSEARPNRGIK